MAWNTSPESKTLDLNKDKYDNLGKLSEEYNKLLEYKWEQIVQISRENLSKLASALNVSDPKLRPVLNALRKKQLEKHVKDSYENNAKILGALEEFKDASFDKKTNSPVWSVRAIFAIQAALEELWFPPDGWVDWFFWEKTKDKIFEFQKNYNNWKNDEEKIEEDWFPWPEVIKALIEEVSKLEVDDSIETQNEEIDKDIRGKIVNTKIRIKWVDEVVPIMDLNIEVKDWNFIIEYWKKVLEFNKDWNFIKAYWYEKDWTLFNFYSQVESSTGEIFLTLEEEAAATPPATNTAADTSPAAQAAEQTATPVAV